MHFEIYRDKKGEYRWRLVASNGKTVADSGEGYVNKLDLCEELEKIRQEVATAPVNNVD